MSKGEETRNNGTRETNNSNSKNSNSSTTSDIGGQSRGINEGKSNIEIPKSIVVETPKPKFVPIEIGTDEVEEKPKPKRKYKKRKTAKKDDSNLEDLQKLIEGVFSVVSLKAGSHWKLSNEESVQIADPLNNILEKHNLLEKVNGMSDGVALIIACVSIVLPRFLITKAMKPKNKKEVLKNNGAITGETKDNKSNKSERDIDNKSTTNVANCNKRIESNDGQFIKSISPNIYI